MSGKPLVPCPTRVGPVTLRLPKDPALLAAARLTAAGVGLRAGASFEAIEDLKVILAEACTYCMRRGTHDGCLEVSLEANVEHLVLTVVDRAFRVVQPYRGAGASALGPEEPDELFMIRGLADELAYHLLPGGGIMLTARRGRQ
jgi:serine/threonine-protein kinase RsbW